MAYKTYTFKEENKKTYKGIEYYKFNDEYIILTDDNVRTTRYSLKDVKNYINNYLSNK